MNRAASLRRSLRANAVRAWRRSPLLPASWPDRLGDEDRLADAVLDQPVVVYFPDPRGKLYQLRQWYAPLRALHERHPVVVIGQDSRAMTAVREESGLPAVTIARYDFMAEILQRSAAQAVFYVNHSPQNFSMLRFPHLAHVYLSHGDSDKGVSVSNQVKAYDFLFVAGQASVDRMSDHLMLTDIAPRCLQIGRPELDGQAMTRAQRAPGERIGVLYAPTWEGAQPSMAYGSVASHGPGLVGALVQDDRFSVVYRPHPLSGSSDQAYGAADAEVRALIDRAQQRDPTAGHRTAVTGLLPHCFAGADVLVCDVSSVAMDWLPTRRPLVVTVAVSPEVETAPSRLLEVVPRLAVDDLATVRDLLASQAESDPSKPERLTLVDYYLGDTSPGAATQRFLDACSHVLDVRAKAWAVVSGEPS